MTFLQLLFLLAATPAADAPDDQIRYQSVEEVDENLYLASPYDMDYAADGTLYVVDRLTSKVHIWNPDGAYRKSFGQKGQGPGEMLVPFMIEVVNGKVYLLAQNRRMSVFSLDGEYLDSFPVNFGEPRRWRVLPDGKILLATRKYNSATDVEEVVLLLDEKGQELNVVKSWKNASFMAPIEGNNDTTFRAFAPDMEIQPTGDGAWWIGYSDTPFLYRVDASGKIVGEKRLNMPSSKPTDADKELYGTMSFPNPGAPGRISLADLPNLKVDYSQNKAFYSQFTAVDGKGIFLMTPVSGTNGVGFGFSEGYWTVTDLATGRPLATGRYKLPEDSQLFLKSGRILAMISDEDAGFQFRSVSLKDNRLPDL